MRSLLLILFMSVACFQGSNGYDDELLEFLEIFAEELYPLLEHLTEYSEKYVDKSSQGSKGDYDEHHETVEIILEELYPLLEHLTEYSEKYVDKSSQGSNGDDDELQEIFEMILEELNPVLETLIEHFEKYVDKTSQGSKEDYDELHEIVEKTFEELHPVLETIIEHIEKYVDKKSQGSKGEYDELDEFLAIILEELYPVFEPIIEYFVKYVDKTSQINKYADINSKECQTLAHTTQESSLTITNITVFSFNAGLKIKKHLDHIKTLCSKNQDFISCFIMHLKFFREDILNMYPLFINDGTDMGIFNEIWNEKLFSCLQSGESTKKDKYKKCSQRDSFEPDVCLLT